ncbi:MAG: PTS sugar transporter subunit IIA [Bacillus sp. (in: firmicutes)]
METMTSNNLLQELMSEDIIWLDMPIKSREDVMTFITQELQKKGYVKEGYLESLLERERNYPTGLPTVPFAVAIPHTDPQYINKPFVAAVRPTQPIPFTQMGTDDVEVGAELLFFLGLNKGEGQVELLQYLIDCCMNEGFMTQLKTVETPNQFMKAL